MLSLIIFFNWESEDIPGVILKENSNFASSHLPKSKMGENTKFFLNDIASNIVETHNIFTFCFDNVWPTLIRPCPYALSLITAIIGSLYLFWIFKYS
jgi:hypothetical protein